MVLVVVGVVVAIVLSRGKDPVAGPGGGNPPDDKGKPAPDGGKPKPGDIIPGHVPKADAKSLLTREKVNKIQIGMKKEDLASLFGPGRAISEEQARAAHVAASQQDGEQRFAKARAMGVRTWEQWGDGGDSLYVGYGPTTRGDRVAYHIRYYTGRAGLMMMDAGPGLWKASELESAAERWDREQAILNDPKWRTGAEARAALLGKWIVHSGGAGYEFLADGTHKWLGAGAYTSTYRFSDPQTLELDSYDPFAKRKGSTIKYRVLVAGDELYLVQQPDSARPWPVGPYKRQPPEKK
jgi:hypothetical protein